MTTTIWLIILSVLVATVIVVMALDKIREANDVIELILDESSTDGHVYQRAIRPLDRVNTGPIMFGAPGYASDEYIARGRHGRTQFEKDTDRALGIVRDPSTDTGI